MLVAWLLAGVFWTTLLGGGGYILLRFIRAYERKSTAAADLAGLEERVRSLEEANTRLESEIAVIGEAQQFTTQLLTERTTSS